MMLLDISLYWHITDGVTPSLFETGSWKTYQLGTLIGLI